MSVKHFYPFDPHQRHGGTLRLANALSATESAEPTELYYWDAVAAHWIGPHPPDRVASPHQLPQSAQPRGIRLGQAKRALFPSTLWESGRHAVRGALVHLTDRVASGDTVVLHTTYLAPLVPHFRAAGARVVVDVYDLVWRAHMMDAREATGAVAAVRETYARRTRGREMQLVASADALAVVGWTDREYVRRATSAPVTWAPVGIPMPVGPSRPGGPTVRIGLIGNFAHSATADAARRLLASPAANDPKFQVVLAGDGSQQWSDGERVVGMGHVGDVNTFYASIDASVVPVANGSGMKCKLAESAMAHKATITTPLGAEGYPPRLAELLTVVSNESAITPDVVRTAIAVSNTEHASDAFERAVSPGPAAELYRRAVLG